MIRAHRLSTTIFAALLALVSIASGAAAAQDAMDTRASKAANIVVLRRCALIMRTPLIYRLCWFRSHDRTSMPLTWALSVTVTNWTPAQHSSDAFSRLNLW